MHIYIFVFIQTIGSVGTLSISRNLCAGTFERFGLERACDPATSLLRSNYCQRNGFVANVDKTEWINISVSSMYKHHPSPVFSSSGMCVLGTINKLYPNLVIASQLPVFTSRSHPLLLSASPALPCPAGVRGHLAHGAASCGVGLWDAWGVCCHGHRHCPWATLHWAEDQASSGSPCRGEEYGCSVSLGVRGIQTQMKGVMSCSSRTRNTHSGLLGQFTAGHFLN